MSDARFERAHTYEFWTDDGAESGKVTVEEIEGVAIIKIHRDGEQPSAMSIHRAELPVVIAALKGFHTYLKETK